MIERKLVTIRTIDALTPIPKADRIECAKIGGWTVVVNKGDFLIGDQCIFIEIDSVVPDEEPFKFLTEKQGKTFYNGKFGARLRTIRLRGQLSQGLALRLEDVDPLILEVPEEELTDVLGIWKYDPPPPASLAGKIAGNWPSWLQKTDQERIQNIDPCELTGEYAIEEKMDGTSMSVWIDENGQLGVGSRNMSLKIDGDNQNNMYVRMAYDSGLLKWLKEHILPQDAPFAIQGELCGPGIQGNPYGFDRNVLFIFDIFAPNKGGKLNWDDRDAIIEDMESAGVHVSIVPLVGNCFLDDIKDDKIEHLLAKADGKSMYGQGFREGLVFKCIQDGNKSFKCISNKYLLSEKD